MKRDFELILKILTFFEERDEISVVQHPQIPNYEDRIVAYHIRRMYEAGLLDAETVNSSTTASRMISVYPFGLTWEGHEFLDTIRQDSVMDKVKKRLGGAISDVPFAVIKGVAVAYAKEKFGL